MPKTSADDRRRLGESLGVYVADTRSAIARLERGLPIRALDRLSQAMDMPCARLAEVARIAPRTLARRRKEGRLQPVESERVFRLGALFDRAVDVLGEVDAARRWFRTPLKALDGQPPLDFARSEVGAREVEDLLGRLEHGVFS